MGFKPTQTKKKLWVTYAWIDNADQDVDYILRELEKSGQLEIHFDRRQLPAGQRLWDNIAEEITSAGRCDAYAVVVTPGSLTSAACQEELAYALDRALSERGSQFPIIPLIYNVEPSAMAACLRVRLGVLLRDSDWIAQVVAASHGRSIRADIGDIGKWKLRVHAAPPTDPNFVFALEIQSRLESIPIWRAYMPKDEKARLKGQSVRASNAPFGGSMMLMTFEGHTDDSPVGPLHVVGSENTLDRSHSLYLYLDSLPSRLWISRHGPAVPLEEVDLSQVCWRVP